MKIFSVVGARPNFMKVAPLHRAFLKHREITSRIIHTGQHHDTCMSDIFFDQLEMPPPDYFMGISGGSHTGQTAGIMLAFEKIIAAERPDIVLVAGDVNSSLACALVAAKEHIPLAHVEAGLRSGDRHMPEEINRILTDAISDQLFVTEESGLAHLKMENIPDSRVHFVGNVMIDSLVHYQSKAARTGVTDRLGLAKGTYMLVTMHRPANVDTKEGLTRILRLLENATARTKAVFPVHPRTVKNMEQAGLAGAFRSLPDLLLLPPQGYLEFLSLMSHALLVLTDSGGIQEETTYLGVPCITFRKSTERPVTVDMGTNYLLNDVQAEAADRLIAQIISGNHKKGTIPPLWDGKAADRIARILLNHYID